MRALLLAAALALPSGAGRAAAQEPARGPYIADVSTGHARVCWRLSDEPGEYPCRWLSGLAAGAEFTYSIPGSTAAWTARTLAPRGRRVRFAAFGDAGKGNASQRRVAREVERWGPDFVLLLGDIVYPNGADHFYDTRYFRPYARLLPKVPFFPAIGNHDYGNHRYRPEEAAQVYRRHYLPIHKRPRYYSFDAGDAHFVSIDDNLEGYGIGAAASVKMDSEQWRWLDSDLAASRARWKIVFLHVPLYSSGVHGGREAVRASLEQVFVRHGVQLVLQGHDHNYERSHPIRNILYVTAGTGGAWPSHRRGEPPWSAAYVRANGFVGIEIRGGVLTLEMIDERGRVRDRAKVLLPDKPRRRE